MSKEIKSIKIIKNFPINPFIEGQEYKVEDFLNCDEIGRIGSLFREIMFCYYGSTDKEKIIYFLENNSEFFQIEYETPTILKRPDGSVISGLEDMIKVLYINLLDFSIEERFYSKEAENLVKQGLIFLSEDKDLAEKKAKMLSKQLEIQYEIDRLNAENSWVADWESMQEKYIFNLKQSFVSLKVVCYDNVGQKVMSQKTAETILAKYSQDELKQYLGIII